MPIALIPLRIQLQNKHSIPLNRRGSSWELAIEMAHRDAARSDGLGIPRPPRGQARARHCEGRGRQRRREEEVWPRPMSLFTPFSGELEPASRCDTPDDNDSGRGEQARSGSFVIVEEDRPAIAGEDWGSGKGGLQEGINRGDARCNSASHGPSFIGKLSTKHSRWAPFQRAEAELGPLNPRKWRSVKARALQ